MTVLKQNLVIIEHLYWWTLISKNYTWDPANTHDLGITLDNISTKFEENQCRPQPTLGKIVGVIEEGMIRIHIDLLK